jgi:hypothetical protein
MKKLIFIASALILFGAGCAAQPTAKTPAAPGNKPAATNNQPAAPALTAEQAVLKQLSFDWQKDGDMNMHAKDVKDNLENCSDIPPVIGTQNAGLVPPTYTGLLTVAAHQCDAALRVYLGCANAIEEVNSPGQWVDVGDKSYACGGWTEKVILEDLKTGQARVLGDLNMVTGGNFGGLFVPLAFTKDDSRVVLNAWMFSPGAGGGEVDLGYKVAPLDSIGSLADAQKVFSLPRQTIFYGDFAKAVYLENSSKLPSFSQPGPASNLGVIMSLDLSTMKSAKLLEETDTTYAFTGIDESKSVLNFKATKNQFTKACPRAEDALICSKKTVKDRILPLP